MSACPKPEKRGPKPRTRPRQQSKSPAAVARRKADREWAMTITEGAFYGRCELVGCNRFAVDAHHVMGKKAHPKLRHNLNNGIAVCRKCHVWIHGHTADFRSWFSAVRPLSWAKLAVR